MTLDTTLQALKTAVAQNAANAEQAYVAVLFAAYDLAREQVKLEYSDVSGEAIHDLTVERLHIMFDLFAERVPAEVVNLVSVRQERADTANPRIERLMAATQDAYQRPVYGETQWRLIVDFLAFRLKQDEDVLRVLRSKLMRQANDEYGPTLTGFQRFWLHLNPGLDLIRNLSSD